MRDQALFLVGCCTGAFLAFALARAFIEVSRAFPWVPSVSCGSGLRISFPKLEPLDSKDLNEAATPDPKSHYLDSMDPKPNPYS